MNSTTDRSTSNSIAPLGREEYVEQAHFFGALADRMRANVPAQEVLQSVREEVLATTKLPMAIDFMLSELRHAGVFSTAMAKLPHYFTPFQSYVIGEAENERGKFDLRIGLEILEREATYRAGDPTRQGVFLYQFETLCRNRLGYDRGLDAVAADPAFDDTWREWITTIRRQVGMVDIADLIYVHSELYLRRKTRRTKMADAGEDAVDHVALFEEQEGRIALANRKKDPLYLFAAFHRQLGYPEVPRPAPPDEEKSLLPQIARRMEQLEKRITLVEEEQRGGFDLSKFYERPQ